ncbi:LysR family transcriptional regulator [Mesorhizobium sp. M7A.F.Ca.AU.001.01.1.1]|nr:LysR family transcriptional regulator [Mesorhizobium sp. M7A.F.Ca.AU.001.01.1.1]
MRLPPLHSLVAFEAAGSHMNFTAAAHELNVTREAVSMQVRLLESRLGAKLFERGQRGVALTEYGRQFHNTVSESLWLISREFNEKVADIPANVTVSTTVAFGSCWLMPRLADFRIRNPGINIKLVETDECLDMSKFGIDISIRYGRGDWNKLKSEKVFSEEFFPICSPGYVNSVGAENFRKFQNVTLLHLDGRAHEWENWDKWLEFAKLTSLRPQQGIWFQNYDNLLRATLEGQGLALGWARLVEEKLSNGSLVRPFDLAFTTGNGYYIVEAPANAPNRASKIFRNWIRDKMRI